MILSKRKYLEEHWDIFISRLQVLRGEGNWRGNLIQVRPKNQIWIPFEPKGSSPEKHELIIYMKAELREIFAKFSDRETPVYLKEFEMDVDKFLRELLKEVRQRTYIRTNKDKASYRGSAPSFSNEQ